MEDEKFEFQLGTCHTFSEWKNKHEMEERLLAHSKFIFDHAELFQVNREEWKKWRRFDKDSYLYIPKN
jgi:hypothetical protein